MTASKNRRKGQKKSPATSPAGRVKAAGKASRSRRDPPGPADTGAATAQFTGSQFGPGPGPDATPLEIAQFLMYDAWENPSKKERIQLARHALKISELCADAHVLLASEEARDLVERRARLEAGVAAGEKALGPEGFKEHDGHFWGVLETRPYMRARHGLAETLWQLGERDAAIGHLQDMLRLNPNDNQGLRYILADWLLAVRDHDALDALIEAYDGDGLANWAYARTLLAFRRSGPSKEARAALEAAWECNHHVPKLLAGTRKTALRMPEIYGPGSREEAEMYVIANRENWASTEGAIEWLATETRDLTPPPSTRGRPR